MDLLLKGKTAFISGSTEGIGLGIARRLAAEGVDLIINGRNKIKLDKVVASLVRDFPDRKIQGEVCDFADTRSVNELLSRLSAVDILINNVGVYTSESFFESKDEDWYRLIELNVMSGVRLSRAWMPGMLEKNWGRILFISSECASIVPPDLLSYSATKMMTHALAKGLAQLTKGTGVTVNVMMPGSTMTEGARKFLDTSAENMGINREAVIAQFFSDVRPGSLLQRFADVDEVAAMACFLCSPLSAATNGADIRVDGGTACSIL